MSPPRPWDTPEPIRKRLEAAGWGARRNRGTEHWFIQGLGRVELTYVLDEPLPFTMAYWSDAYGKAKVDEFWAILSEGAA